MSVASVTSTRCTVWPLMSIPRIAAAFSWVSSGERGQLHPAGLAPPTGLDLRLDHDGPAQLGGRGGRLLGGLDRPARQHRDTVRGEEILRLVLVEVHWLSLPTAAAHSGVRARCDDPSDAHRTRSDLVR